MITFTSRTGTDNPFADSSGSSFDVGGFAAPTLADIDNDGDLDAVIGEDGGTLKYFENVGNASTPDYVERTGAANPFTDSSGTSIVVSPYANPTLVDIDDDGDLDAVIGGNDGTLKYFENVGDASIPDYVERTGAANPFTDGSGDSFDVGRQAAPTLADVDDDGDLDALIGANDGALKYFENVGDASAPDYVERTGITNPFTDSSGASFNIGLRAAPALADVDGDGDLDVVIGERTGTLKYFENIGDASTPDYVERTGIANPFTDSSGSSFDVGFRAAPTLADVDNDGDLDVVVGDKNGTLNYFENTSLLSVKVNQTGGAVTATGNNGDDTVTLTETGGTLTFVESGIDIPVSSIDGRIVLRLGEGNNTLAGSSSSTGLFLTSGSGIDQLTGGSGRDTFISGDGADILTGGGENDILRGEGGNDTLNGGDGRDFLNGGAGDDQLNGGAGRDFLHGGAGVDSYNGGDGVDVVDFGNATVGVTVNITTGIIDSGEIANETITEVEDIIGSSMADTLTGNSNKNNLKGNAGNDILNGEGDDDTLNGGAGQDVLNGGSGKDRLIGGKGNDTLNGDDGKDLLSGGSGNDTLNGGADNDTLSGEDGRDTLNGDSGNDVLKGGAGKDRLNGGDGNDKLFGGDGNDRVFGDDGNDMLDGGSGNDQIVGKSGDDRLYGRDGSDILSGGRGNDQLNGNDGSDTLNGHKGNDTLNGGAGDDFLKGGTGRDTLTGGDGSDEFIFTDLSDSLLVRRDSITDLVIGTDVVKSSQAIAASAIDQLGNVSRLTESNLQALLTTDVFESNTAATFTRGIRTYLAINDATAGFSANKDAIIEITGYTGADLSSLAVAANVI